jgi:hypothetical protein
MQRIFRVSVSLEYDLDPVQTVKLEIQAGSWPTAFARAAKQARKAFPGARPRSVVIVLEQPTVKVLTESEDSVTLPA